MARSLARLLAPGDTVLLTGGVGAGKTHFARALIQSILTVPEDVPSPTFTLVQTYDTTQGPLWHADLYRVGSVHEIEELGIADAFDTAICLIEWPDRLGDLRPDDALDISLDPGADDTDRRMQVTGCDRTWSERLKKWTP
ncbi:tRNA (adenosine(37)-N6)-threonylcarbamoyltransferase complex ATPase subunit type 1 TsaE [Sulfitobacter sabulilitoris]